MAGLMERLDFRRFDLVLTKWRAQHCAGSWETISDVLLNDGR